MKVNVSKISGIDDAILSLYFSKRSWTPELSEEVRAKVAECTCRNGFLVNPNSWLEEKLALLKKYGIEYGHEVLLSFIDITIETQGLHRAGQDDWDSHAQRFNNRIVRSSTRLGKFTGGEKSDFYKDKILYFSEVMSLFPPTIERNGHIYVYTDFGYVRADCAEDPDVVRGLYPLAIPSDNITKIDYRQLRHVYKMRGAHSSANPEVKQVAEGIRQDLLSKFWVLGEWLQLG